MMKKIRTRAVSGKNKCAWKAIALILFAAMSITACEQDDDTDTGGVMNSRAGYLGKSGSLRLKRMIQYAPYYETVEFMYDSGGKLSAIYDSNGTNSMVFSDEEIEWYESGANRTVSVLYNSDGYISQFKSTLSRDDTYETKKLTTSYAFKYDNVGHLTSASFNTKSSTFSQKDGSSSATGTGVMSLTWSKNFLSSITYQRKWVRSDGKVYNNDRYICKFHYEDDATKFYNILKSANDSPAC